MSEPKHPGLVDRAVELVARALNALGFNGTRLLWKWNQKRRTLGESGLRSEILWRSARGAHKMCPACRALVPRNARACPECGGSMAGVAAPGLGRLVGQVLPGTRAATPLLLLVNGFWFLLMLLASTQVNEPATSFFGLLRQFDSELLFNFGSGAANFTRSGEWWRIVTPIFLHAGLLHFFFNSWVLVQVGSLAESEFATDRFWVVYLFSGIAGSATSQILRPHAVNTIGASGAILGVIGLLLVHGWRAGGVRGHDIRRMMLTYLAYILVFSLIFRGMRIDHWNHAGGLVAGAVAGLVVPAGPHRSTASAVAWQSVALAGVLLVLVCFWQVSLRLT